MNKPISVIHAETTENTQTIMAVTGGVQIQAASGEGSENKSPTFKANAYNGGPLMVAGFDLPIIVDLKGLEYAPSITANLDHDKAKRVGHIDEKVNDGSKLELSGIVSASTASATEFVESAKKGYPWQGSIEALPMGRPELIKAGESVTVNNQTFRGPVYVSRKTKLFGFAFLPRGADESTSVTIAAQAANTTKGSDMTFEQWIEAAGLNLADLTDQQKSFLTAEYQKAIKAEGGDTSATGNPPTIGKPKFDIDELKASYAAHESVIESKLFEYDGKVESHKLAEIKAEAQKASVELKSKAIENEWSHLQFEAEAIKASSALELKLVRAERPKGPSIHSSQQDASPQVIEAALCMQRGHSTEQLEESFKPEVLEAAHKNYRSFGLQQMLIMAASMNGYTCRPGEGIHMGNLREVLEYAFPPRIHASGISTLSLSGILSNVANKDILMGYMEEDQTWREFAEVKRVNDFKTVTAYRMLDDMEYEELPKGGQIAHGKLSEESYTRQAKTYAKMFALDRVDIINDDLGAFDDLRRRVGGGAAKKFNNVFWTAFLNNATFFTSGRGNYISGATSNLGLDGVGLQQGITAFRKLRSPSADGSKRVGGRPEILLVPPELEFTADKLYTSANVNTGGSSTADSVPDRNIHQGKYRPVVCDWLSDSDFTGYSSTAWYLFRNPRNMAAMVVSFLFGQQTPTVESSDADFNQLGVQLRGYHDFGCDKAEYLAGLKSKGAA